MKVRILHWKRAVFAVLFTLLLSVAGVTKATAQSFTVGDLNYTINDDGASVTLTGHVDGISGQLVIPESVELYGTSYPVTGIGWNAFEGCGGITGTLVIPNSITYIGGYAFQYSGLNSSVTIPESVTYIGFRAFAGCSITSYYFNATNCDARGWVYDNHTNAELFIGDNVQVISESFLSQGSNFIGTLVIPESVTQIGRYAFEGCSGFTGALSIPEAVTFIDENAFNGCSGFSGLLTLGNSITSIGESAFSNCVGLSGSLTIPNSVTTIGSSAFLNCSGFSGTLTLGNSLTQINNSAFFGACENFTSFNVLAETPPTLGTNAFLSVNMDIPVYVTCGTLEAFQNASGWSSFTNLQENNPCMWEILATANPSDGGTVSGAGIYEQGQTCTLTASPNENYVFVNWIENGVEVSTDAEYSFTVEGNRNLMAHFIIPTYTITVTANPSDAGTITGLVTTFDFEDAQIPSDWNNNSSYPWIVTTGGNNESYCMKSGNTNFNNTTSSIETTVYFSQGGSIAFYSRISSEGCCDRGCFYIDDVQQVDEGGESNWTYYTFDVTAGYHTFRWSYSKDVSVHTNQDGYFIDDVTFTGLCVYYGVGSYYTGETCTLTATPSSDNFVFVNWTEDGEVVSSNAQYSFTVTNDRELVANFVQIRFDITASANPEEGGTIEGTGNYMVGQTCTLTATPNENYEFINWTEDGEIVSTNAEYAFLVATDRHLVANFAIPTYTITATANPTEGGAITYDGGVMSLYDFEDGTLQGWTAVDADGDGRNWYTYYTPNSSIGAAHSGGYVASSWSWSNYTAFDPDNYLISPQITDVSSITYFVAVNSGYPDHYGVYASTTGNDINDFTLVFEETVPVTKGNEGRARVSMDGSGTRDAMTSWYERTIALPVGTKYVAFRHYASYDMNYLFIDDIRFNMSEMVYEQGSTCTMTAVPNYGYAFENWTEGGNVISTDAELSFTVTNDRNLVANFVLTPFTINATPNFDDRGTVSGSGEYVINQTCTLIATPNEGHNFVHWMENGEVVSTESSYSFTVDGPRDLVAVFTAHVDNIIVFADPDTKYVCVNNWDTDGDGELTYDEAAAVWDLGWGFYENYDINTFDELQYFTGLSYIGDWTFEYCYYLSSIIIPNTVTSIGSYAFQHCGSLSSIVMPNSLTSIGDGAFYECYSLNSITFPESLVSIGNEAFHNCTGLRGELTLPESLDWVGEYAFASCDEITTINYNAVNCSVMGNSQHPVFYDCLSVEHIHIGENVESIPSYAFKRCSNVADIRVDAMTPPSVGVSAFATISHSVPVYVPCGTSEAYQSATGWGEFTNIQEDCSQIHTQTITLAAGWNWFSTNLDITLDDLKVALVAAVPGTTISINSQSDGSTTYTGNRWRGTLNSMDVSQMYMISVTSSCEMTLEGMRINPAEHPATIHGDFNWIGFPLSQSMTLTNAFEGFVVNGDMVISQADGSSTYTNRWRGVLNTLVSGKGYMYKSSVQGDRTFTFPINTK